VSGVNGNHEYWLENGCSFKRPLSKRSQNEIDAIVVVCVRIDCCWMDVRDRDDGLC